MAETTLEIFAEQLAAADEPEQEVVENAQPEEDAQSDEPQDGLADEEPTEDDGEQDSEQPEAASTDDQLIEWTTASGEKFSAPVAELKQGYMRNQDYTQKTQELAKERDTAHQQIQQQFQVVEQFAQEFGALQSQNTYIGQLEQAISQADRHSDPVGYNAAVNELILARQHRDGLATRIDSVRQQRTQEQQQRFAAAQKQAVTELATGPGALPGFNKELVQKINATGHEYGYSDQELAAVVDPRAIRILHDAMQYRELQAKKPDVVNKVKQAPQKPAKQTASNPIGGIEKEMKQFGEKKDLNSFARLLQHTL